MSGARLFCGLIGALATGAAHAQLPVYDATQLAPHQYRLVKRIWVDDGRTAFDTPRDATRDGAMRRLMHAAEAAGANAVLNAYCLNAATPPRGYYCYGSAVRLNPK